MGNKELHLTTETKMTTFTNRTFGVEFEGYGVPMSMLVRKLRNAGINAGETYYSNRDTSYWRVKPDGSLRGDSPFEIVSPILRGEAGLAEMKLVLDTALAAGAKVNITCGFHVHWGVADWDLPNFRNLAARYVKFERAIDSVMPKSRRQNNQYYCQGWLRGNAENKTTTANMWKTWMNCTTIRNMANKLGSGRYHKLNLNAFWSHKTVEFRQHSGTFEYAKAEAWVRLTGAMVEQASNRERLQNWTTGTEDNQFALKTMLKGMVKSGFLPKAIANIWKTRQKHFEERDRIEEQA